jgi:hypothetical protein
MRPSRRSGIVAGFVGAQTFPDGRFEFPNVAPGDYVIEAFKGNEFGWRGVTVNGDDVSDVEVQTLPGSTISGRVIFEGTRSQTAGRVGIEAMPSDVDYAPFAGGGASTQAQDDGTFLIERAIGARRLRVTPPRGWMLKRITIAGEDITDVALPFGTDKQSLKDVDVVLTDEVTEIAGVVSDAHDAPTAGALVVAFPEDADRRYDGSRYFAKTRSSRDGTYALRALPPARYCVAVVDRMVAEEDAWQDPEFLERLERDAARVTVTDGQRASLVLRVRP